MPTDDDVKKGDRVRFRKRGQSPWQAATVETVWWALDELSVSVRTDDGLPINLLPCFGDEIERANGS